VAPEDVGTVPADASQDGVTVSGSVTADHITVDPGDNTGTFTCPGAGTPWAPGASTPCAHIYRHSSAGKGEDNSFPVTVTVSWSGDYTATVNGAAAPGGSLGPVDETSHASLRVSEVQAINN
jgi:hypothetical protein